MWNFLAPPAFKPEQTGSEADERYRRLRWQVFIGIFIGYAGFYIVRKNFSMAIPMLAPFGFEKGELGVVLSMNAIAYGFSKFVMASISDRSNAQRFLPLGLILAAISMMFMIVPVQWIGADNKGLAITLMAVLNFLVGWFNGMGWPPCGRVMTHWFSIKERGTWMSFWNCAHNVGGALVGPMAVYGAAWFGSWFYGADEKSYFLIGTYLFPAAVAILIAIIAGYIAALLCGIVDFSKVASASFFALPNFSTPKFKWEAIVIILPVILVIASEHIGHQIVTSKIVGRDLLKDPGLHRSLFADNFSTMISGFIGSVPTTTYGENIGVMAMTKVYSVYVIAGAAVLSIICSFIGKMTTLISTIPGPVIGGISFLLYGMIGTSGIRILVDSQVDYARSRNMAMTSIIFVTGLSGIKVQFGSIQLTGMVLACVVGMIMGLMFFLFDKLKLTNDRENC